VLVRSKRTTCNYVQNRRCDHPFIVEGTSFDDMVRLRSYVTDTVENAVRLVSNQREHIIVKVIPFLLSYNGLNAKEQTLQSTFSLRLEWTQEILSWNISDFGGLDNVVLSAGQIWTPSILAINSFFH